MNKQILPSNHFTDITVSVLADAPVDHLEVLIGQLVLDADIDVLCSINAHHDFKGLAVLAEWHSLKTDCAYMRMKFLHVVNCAMKAYLIKAGI
tara:strand:- start:628 stop:906 length:279 start_codon:yes stop_codon:yes gene_type:complete